MSTIGERRKHILDSILKDGFVKVSELIYTENYKMDHEGRQYVEGLSNPSVQHAAPTPSGTLREY